MGLTQDFNAAIAQKIDDADEAGLKVIPVTIATINPLTVYIQASTTAAPAVFMAGHFAPVGASVYALWWPGAVAPLVFTTTAVSAAGPYEATSASVQTLTTATFTTVTGWASSQTATDYWFTSYAAGVWTIRDAGIYRFEWETTFATSAAAGERIAALFKGGTEQKPRALVPGGISRVVGMGCTIACAAGDQITVRALQSTGSNLALDGAARAHLFRAQRLAA